MFIVLDLYIVLYCLCLCFFFFKQKTAYEMRISGWSSDVCSSDLRVSCMAMIDPEAGLCCLFSDQYSAGPIYFSPGSRAISAMTDTDWESTAMTTAARSASLRPAVRQFVSSHRNRHHR